jgi:hypothetical protein
MNARKPSQSKYTSALFLLPMGLMLGSVVPTWFISRGLGHALNLPDDAPVRDQPYGVSWLILLFATMLVLFIGGAWFGLFLRACLLRFVFGWPWSAALRQAGPRFLFGSWGHRTDLPGAKQLGEDNDPMFDHQVDEVTSPSLFSGQ